MPFVRPTLNELIIRTENDFTSRLTGAIPLLSRALLKIISRVLSGAWDTIYGHQEFLSFQIIIDKAEEAFVRRWAFQWRIPIQEATFAIGNIQFSGVDTTILPLDTLLVRDDGVEYITTAPGTVVSGSVIVPIICTTAGEIGNAPANTVLSLSSPIVDISDTGFLTGTGAEGGVEADTKDIILQNLLNRLQNPPMGGSDSDYKRIAEDVAGVEKGFPFENQAGTAKVLGSVTVVIKGVTPIIPSSTLLDEVLTALLSPKFKPLTSSIFVAPINSKTIDYDISLTPDTAAIRQNIQTNLEQQHTKDMIPGGSLLISRIRNAISTSGVSNYVINSITVEGQGSVPIDQDIVFTGFEYGFVNNLIFSAL